MAVQELSTQEFQKIFADIQTAIADLIIETLGPSYKVYTRDAVDEDESIWVGNLKNDDGEVKCFTVAYDGCPQIDDEGPTGADIYIPEYRIVGYHYFDFGTNVDNSSKRFQDDLHALRFEFMNNRTLGLDSPVNEHQGFREKTVLARIDTQTIHIARAHLQVKLLPLAYEYN